MEYFKLESKGIEASGYQTQDGKFMVLKGSFAVGDSQLAPEFSKSLKKRYKDYKTKRDALIATKKLEKSKKSQGYEFTENVEFSSPSQAASIILGSNENGILKFGIGKKNPVNRQKNLEANATKAIEVYRQDENITQKRQEEDNIVSSNRLSEEVTSDQNLIEGAVCQVTINSYERNPEARRRCIEHYGTSCCVCGFNFEAKFGAGAKGFIHVHHLEPLSEIKEEYKVNPITDLRPVCPNCHAMIHLGGKTKSIEELKSWIQKQC